MKQVRLVGRWHWLLVLLLLIGTPFAVASFWRSASKDIRGDGSQLRQKYETRIREGLGSEVRFSNSGDSRRDAKETVDSIARFIAGRSGALMSSATNARLAGMEERALSGQDKLTSVEDLTDALTETISARASTLTDKEISRAAGTLRAHHEVIFLRATGEFTMSSDEFEAQAKVFRDLSREGNVAAREALRTLVNREVEDRVSLLEKALPEQFGAVRQNGVTPAKAVLITYSVISDDLLDGTQQELQKTVRQLPEVVNRKVVPGTKAEKAFGNKGRIFSAPIDLVFNKATMSSLLDRLEGGRDSK